MSKAKKVQPSSQQRTLWQETWRRFKKNKLAVAGMIFLWHWLSLPLPPLSLMR